MTIRTFAATLAAASALGLSDGALAAPGDYVSIVQETKLELPAEAAWGKLNSYCAIGAWLKTTCEITAGQDGQVGALRKIAGRIEEVIVAVTPLSYTYADINPAILYHGTVEVRPVDRKSSKLVYSLFFDQTSVAADQREANKLRRAAMFKGVMATMKATAEAK